jgi:hypothetical protein
MRKWRMKKEKREGRGERRKITPLIGLIEIGQN